MTAYAELAQRYDQRRSAYLGRLGRAQATQERTTTLLAQVEADTHAALVDEAVAQLFQHYATVEHGQLLGRIEGLVTQGIHAVFGPIYSFRVAPGAERGQATIRFWLVTADGTEHPVMDAQGGGLASIVGFILRVVVLALRPGAHRRLLVLDETFGMVSADYHAKLADFLRMLVDDLGLQILLITHAPEQGARADRVYRMAKPGTASVATLVGTESL